MIGEKAPQRIDRFAPNPFIDGPGDYLVKMIAKHIKATKEFDYVFGDNIDTYRREDYDMRGLPALRIYNLELTKESESWWVVGNVMNDIIWPANIRRAEQQALQDITASALLQQYRNMDFFEAVRAMVPGLNQLGMIFHVNKALGFQWETEESPVVPLTQITVNFRLDLREWDLYLEATDRTKQSPFDKVLKDLDFVSTTIRGMRGEESEDQDVTTVQDNEIEES